MDGAGVAILIGLLILDDSTNTHTHTITRTHTHHFIDDDVIHKA